MVQEDPIELEKKRGGSRKVTRLGQIQRGSNFQ